MKKFLAAVFAVATVLTMSTAAAADVCDGSNCNHEAAVGSEHYDTLAEAISNANGQEIKLLKDIDIAEPIIVTGNVTIDGSNNGDVFQITSSTTSGYYRQGLFHMSNENDEAAVLTLKNVELVNKNWSSPCGISVRASNQTVNLENVIMDTSYYCIFVGVPGGESEDVNNVTINIDDSKLTGYAAIYYRTNSETNMIMNPVLNVTNSELTGRGVNGSGNGFSTIVYNGTRNARATISGCTLSNSFDASNADADEGIIQFNCYGAYEEGAEITVSNSTIKTRSTTAAPNVIKYTAGENLNVGNKVIIDNLTILVDENESDLIRVMRNGNELVATGKELDDVLSLTVYHYGDKLGGSDFKGNVSLVAGGDTVLVPVDTSLESDATIPENVTVVISKGATLTVSEGVTLSGAKGAKLVIQGTVEGLEGVTEEGSYIWAEGVFVKVEEETPDPEPTPKPAYRDTVTIEIGGGKTESESKSEENPNTGAPVFTGAAAVLGVVSLAGAAIAKKK